MNTSIQEAIKLVEAGHTESGLKKLADIEPALHDEDKAIAAQLYYEWGIVDRAIAIVSDLHELYPGETELTCFYAELLIETDQEEKALRILETIPETDKAFPESLLLMADLYQMQGLFEVSEQKLLKAKALLPEEPVIDFALGELYFTQGAYGKAVSQFKKAVRAEAVIGGVNVYQRLAESLSTSGEFEEALEWYEKAVQENPEPNTLFGFGFTALKAGYPKTAIKQLTELKQLDPAYSSLYKPLANSYEEEGLYEEAFETAKEGIRVDEYNKELYLSAAKMALKTKRPSEAKDLLQEALALDPGYIEAVHTLLSLYLEEEDFESIIDLVEEVRKYGEDDPKFSWFLASAFAGLEEYEKARGEYEAACLNYQEDGDFLYEYALFLLEEGRRKEALPLLKKIVELDPANEEVHEMIFRIEDENSFE
ncbi:tetratricopeptide repeat protein [Bacillus sonorensis]|uniref:tetratricopeptide repeat protein n=1 Tax=Bacillus sonorensis TaxID=119858 RepID=UPI0004982BAF|nr:tetratricopeptide repeat protein [Bacillus sonorensis]MCF7618072.1 tetratricopeptide repeat protein [Bacillus sonorensis]MCY7856792.1 tetratricopeptide repeat protein [Bacillus sonorensis]MCY8036053.1 tetratricopeptide repeat protein [Bacillus sonorensis]MCY8089610.1 tetratricopeptide repeat protein [Bacillus sonorensis]MCY8272372.1 tetratricopeptide repeat protein [Bacillus sonorensis]